MTEDKIYYQETISDTPFPTQEDVPLASDSATSDPKDQVYSPKSTKEESFPKKVIARETIGQAINTKSRKILAEFQFTESGALQIGKYENGISGDLRISPNGIIARNIAGITTFFIDADTGDAYFRGNITSGSLITGSVRVGGDNIELDGDANQILIRDEDGNVVVLIGYQQNGF